MAVESMIAGVLPTLAASHRNGGHVVRAFAHLREMIDTHKDPLQHLYELEQTTEAMSLRRDTFSCNTRVQLKQVFTGVQGDPRIDRSAFGA